MGYRLSNEEIEFLESDDIITPFKIKHDIDYIFNGYNIDIYYNYIDYHFERNGVYCVARAYLDEINSVSIRGIFSGSDRRETAKSREMLEVVCNYLKRRYRKIEVFKDGEYKTIWTNAYP